ncbi:proline-rich protein 23B-like [Rhynchocyon petersi]
MSLRHPRSPSPSSSLQGEGLPPAKRGRWEEPMDQAAQAIAQDPVTSVVVLAAGCSLKMVLPEADLVLEPTSESLLRVAIGNHTLLLMQETFLRGIRRQSDAPITLELGPLITALEEATRQQEAFTPVADMEDSEFLQLCITQFCLSDGHDHSPCPQDSIPASSPWVHALDSFLPQPGPNSPLHPLPPSPNPDPQEHSAHPSRAPCRARRRLF